MRMIAMRLPTEESEASQGFRQDRGAFSAEIVRQDHERFRPASLAMLWTCPACRSMPFKTLCQSAIGAPGVVATGVPGELQDCYEDMTRSASQQRRDRPVSVAWVQPTRGKPVHTCLRIAVQIEPQSAREIGLRPFSLDEETS